MGWPKYIIKEGMYQLYEILKMSIAIIIAFGRRHNRLELWHLRTSSVVSERGYLHFACCNFLIKVALYASFYIEQFIWQLQMKGML